MAENKLQQIRKQLDMIDANIVALIAKRISYLPDVMKYKKEHGLPLYQPKREKEIIASRGELAMGAGVDPDFTKKVFRLILKNSRDIQKGME
jgi:chorismate mutase-like protein